MANYRPKSLDELNNLYGKSLNAQQEIVKKATVLEEKAQPKETGFAPEEVKPEVKTREQAASEQISGYVDDFIKSFGNPVMPDRTAAATVTASMKTVPVGKPAEPHRESEAVRAAAENHSEDKPRLIRNSERNSLFENYKKVMDDEDDYDFSEPESEKKKPKKLFDKKAVKPAQENKPEETAEAKKAEAEVKGPEPTAEPKATAEPVKAETAKPAAIAETEVEVKQEAEEEKAEKKKRSKAKKEKAPKQKKQKAPKESKGTVSRAIVMLLIFCVLLCATAVGGIKAFSGINTDSLIMDKYRVYTADRDYSRLGINSGDLVVVEHRGIDYDDVFAYKKNGSEYGFARLTTVLNDESVIADDGDLRCLVFNDTVRGVVYKTIPAVGSVAAFVMSDFLVALGALLALALVLMLIAIFGCKPKKKKAKKEKPEKPKKKKAKKEKPEKVKKEKKSRKNKEAEEIESAAEAQQPDEAAEADDAAAYDAVEADFSFLLQEYMDEPTETAVPVEAEADAGEETPVEAEADAGEETPVEAEAPEEAEAVYEPAEEPAVKYEISENADEDEEASE